MADVIFENVWKKYDEDSIAVKDLSIRVNKGEFVVLVGPSGCGKTTSLRMLAGLEDITNGNISIGGAIVNDLAPKDRGVGMVFQSYALYPHMNIRDNLSFGLRMQGMATEEVSDRVVKAADLLGLSDYLERLPKHLSGGQRQRVALGRALVRRPAVLLMDEPLSNLDAKLRNQMRFELRRLHEELGTTTIYVTHDQIEAMTLADRIVVMNEGRMQQFSEPLEAYHNPANTFVASFLGTPPMNLICGEAIGGIFRTSINNGEKEGKNFEIPLPEKYSSFSGDCTLGVRPENVALEIGKSDGEFSISGSEQLGSETIVHLQLGDITIAAVWHRPGPDENWRITSREESVDIIIEDKDIRLFDNNGDAINNA